MVKANALEFAVQVVAQSSLILSDMIGEHSVLQASCNPVAYSLLADFFPSQHRAFALSVYHYGVYLGKTGIIIILTLEKQCSIFILSLSFSMKTLSTMVTMYSSVNKYNTTQRHSRKPLRPHMFLSHKNL